jgi:hypothetical protein
MGNFARLLSQVVLTLLGLALVTLIVFGGCWLILKWDDQLVQAGNKRTYDLNENLCQRSGCTPDCGIFQYNAFNKIKIEYLPSDCEAIFRFKEKSQSDNVDIRKRYKNGSITTR